MDDRLPTSKEALERLARQLEREWWWINGALHALAQLAADGPRSAADLRAQARSIDERRLAVSVRLAELSQAPGAAQQGVAVAASGRRPRRDFGLEVLSADGFGQAGA